MLLKKILPLTAWLVVGATVADADVVELKDAAAISGKILAEKRDAVIVDVGYTALVIPRSAVAKIISGEQTITSKAPAKEKKTASAAGTQTPVVPPVVVASQGFYHPGNKLGSEKNVR